MGEKLKPCPACGGEAGLVISGHYVVCESRDCYLEGPACDPDGSKWNALPRRTDAKAPAGMSDAELIASAIRAHAMMVGREESLPCDCHS